MSKKISKEGKSSPPYRESLGDKEKARYMEKLSLIDGNDPYEMKTFSADQKLLPSISYPDIVNYLVFSPSPYTLEDLKSYKGLDAYNQFVCGWLREVSTSIVNDKHIVSAKVRCDLKKLYLDSSSLYLHMCDIATISVNFIEKEDSINRHR